MMTSNLQGKPVSYLDRVAERYAVAAGRQALKTRDPRRKAELLTIADKPSNERRISVGSRHNQIRRPGVILNMGVAGVSTHRLPTAVRYPSLIPLTPPVVLPRSAR